MKLKDTGLTAAELKAKASKYIIETYERFDFVADSAKGVYIYDENGTPYLDFYAGIAVNSVGYAAFQLSLHSSAGSAG